MSFFHHDCDWINHLDCTVLESSHPDTAVGCDIVPENVQCCFIEVVANRGRWNGQDDCDRHIIIVIISELGRPLSISDSNLGYQYFRTFPHSCILEVGVTMDGLLAQVSISYKDSRKNEENLLSESVQSVPQIQKREANSGSLVATSTLQDILEVLRDDPDHPSLICALKLLSNENAEFRITDPSPLAAQIIHVLVSDITPNFWHILGGLRDQQHGKTHRSEAADSSLLIVSLRSVPGLSAILHRLKELIQTHKEHKSKIGGTDIPANLDILLQLVTEVLRDDDSLLKIWNSFDDSASTARKKALWNECLGLLGSGKLLGICAEAEKIVNDAETSTFRKFWISNGASYSKWLGSNIVRWAKSLPNDSGNAWKSCGEMLSKAFRLGNTGMNVIPRSIHAVVNHWFRDNIENDCVFLVITN